MRISKLAVAILAISSLAGANASKADAPAWMHNLTSSQLPPHDDRADAAILYSERIVTVLSADKVRETVRVAYKILRPDGREHGTVFVSFNPTRKVTNLHGWCIPVQGKDYEVKGKDAIEISLPKIAGSELVSDVKDKMLQIPAADPGSIVGYEYELEESPLVLQTTWSFQEVDPVKTSKFTLQLPPGWEYKAVWLNHEEAKAQGTGNNEWQWQVSDVKGLRSEERMPPWPGVAGHMIVSYFPPRAASSDHSFRDWQQMGNWYLGLTRGRRDVNPEIKKEVDSLTASAHTPLQKMQAIGQFVQADIRYVAISLGIGGIQPHSAAEVFQHRYGDCKDKVTLMSSMLNAAGFESYYVIVNSERGSVAADTPAHVGAFDHAIIAIKIPDDLSDPSVVATAKHPKLGRLLFFDPTVTYVPFGQLGGYLQESYALLVAPEGGELLLLPKQPAATMGSSRKGVITLTANGDFTGEFSETHRGDAAWEQREFLKTRNKETDKVKLIESLLAESLPTFAVTKATILNLDHSELPFGYTYAISAQHYAKTAGDLLLVRPRIVGVDSRGLMEKKDPRQFPVMFEGPEKDTDTFEITLPAGFVVDDLPPAVDVDYSFASYHSKTEASGNVLKYSRTYEVKELSVPLSKAEELKKFYRIIANDERNTAVLKPAAK